MSRFLARAPVSRPPAWFERLERRTLLSVLMVDGPTTLVPFQIGATPAGGVRVNLNGTETDYSPGQWTEVRVQLYQGSVGVNATVVPTTIVGSPDSAPTVEVGDDNGLQDIKSPLTVIGRLSLLLNDQGDQGKRNAILGVVTQDGQSRQVITGLAPAPISSTAAAGTRTSITTGGGSTNLSINGTLATPQDNQFLVIVLDGGRDTLSVNALAAGSDLSVFGNGPTDSVQVNDAKGGISDQSFIDFEADTGAADSIAVTGAGVADGFDVLPGSVGHDGHQLLRFRNVSSLTLSAGTFAVNDDLAGAALTASDGAHVNLAASQSLAALSALGGSVITLAASQTPDQKTIFASALNVRSGKLDLTNNALLVPYDPQAGGSGAAIAGWIHPEPLRQRWADVGIFTSSGDTSHTLGYVDNRHNLIPSLPRYSVLIKYTLRGDANLDGRVDFADLALLAQHYGQPPDLNWYDGDFTYDRRVTFADLLVLTQNYQRE